MFYKCNLIINMSLKETNEPDLPIAEKEANAYDKIQFLQELRTRIESGRRNPLLSPHSVQVMRERRARLGGFLKDDKIGKW